jgi:hypothetical protein
VLFYCDHYHRLSRILESLTDIWFCSTLSPFAIELITRLQASFAEYFGETSDDRLMAFGINPVLLTLGAIELIATLDDNFGGTEGTDLVEKSKDLIKARVLDMYKEKIAASDASTPNEGLFCSIDTFIYIQPTKSMEFFV